MSWIYLALDRGKCWAVVITVMNLYVELVHTQTNGNEPLGSINCGELFD